MFQKPFLKTYINILCPLKLFVFDLACCIRAAKTIGHWQQIEICTLPIYFSPNTHQMFQLLVFIVHFTIVKNPLFWWYKYSTAISFCSFLFDNHLIIKKNSMFTHCEDAQICINKFKNDVCWFSKQHMFLHTI